MDAYSDIDESKDLQAPKGPGGRPRCAILDEVSILTKLKYKNRKKGYRCAGAPTGCRKNWSYPRDKSRILKHAAMCSHLPSDVIQRVNMQLHGESASARLASQNSQPIVKALTQSGPAKRPAASMPGQPAGKKFKLDFDLRESAKSQGRKDVKDRMDLRVVRFFCVAGLPAHKADLDVWKDMWAETRMNYTPPSATSLTDVHIPKEAAFVQVEQINYLKECNNLTVSFDGQTIRRPQSVYTVNVSTRDRRCFLVDGHEASAESHTGEYIFGVLNKVFLS